MPLKYNGPGEEHGTNMHALVIGGTRFIGRHTVMDLLAHGYHVTLVTRGRHENPFADHAKVQHVQVTGTTGRRSHALASGWCPTSSSIVSRWSPSRSPPQSTCSLTSTPTCSSPRPMRDAPSLNMFPGKCRVTAPRRQTTARPGLPAYRGLRRGQYRVLRDPRR